MADKLKTYQVGNIKITIDRSKCISCGLCSEIAPKTFELDDKMICIVKSEGPYDNLNKIKEAIESCAVQALTEES